MNVNGKLQGLQTLETFSLFSVGWDPSINLNETLMATVEQKILGSSLTKVLALVSNTNQFLSQLNRTNPTNFSTSCNKVKSKTMCQKVFPKALMSRSVDVLFSNYTCMAGGHWKPKDCLPKSKVSLYFTIFFSNSQLLQKMRRTLKPD